MILWLANSKCNKLSWQKLSGNWVRFKLALRIKTLNFCRLDMDSGIHDRGLLLISNERREVKPQTEIGSSDKEGHLFNFSFFNFEKFMKKLASNFTWVCDRLRVIKFAKQEKLGGNFNILLQFVILRVWSDEICPILYGSASSKKQNGKRSVLKQES